MAADEGNVRIEKFDCANFGFWKMQIEDYLYQKKLYQPLLGKKPNNITEDDWNLLDRQALGVIRLTLSRNVAFNIVKEKTTAGLMAALSSMYEKPSASNKVHLMRRLFNLRMTEGASVAQHLNELNTICHAPDPGPTRLANPNRFRGAKPYTGTPYYFFFLQS